MADFNSQCGETSRKRKRKRKRPVGKGKGRDEAGDKVGRDEAGNHSPRIECLEMDKMTVDEKNVFTKLLSDLSEGSLCIVKDYYSPRFWSQLLSVYHERMSHLNRPFKQRTWLDMISMGQDVQYQYNMERAVNRGRAAGRQINSHLEGIFGRCQSCDNRIPIFPTSLQQGRVSTYTSASQAKNAGSGHGSSSGGGNPGFSGFGGGNPGFSGFGGGNVGNPGFSNVGNPGFSNGGESSSLPQDILNLLVDLLEKGYLSYDQWMNLRKAFTKWTGENHFVLFTLLRNPEIPLAKKVEYLRKESEELL